jgi:hypothetical protein
MSENELGVADMGAGFDPSGVNAMAISPDGKTLIVFGYQNSSPNQTVAHSIPLLPAGAFGLLGPRVTVTNTTCPPPGQPCKHTPAEDYAPAYGPQDVAITPDQAPVAHLAPAAGIAGSPVTLDASSSTVAYGSIVRYNWSFGDGHTIATSTPTVVHTYSAPSAGYPVTVIETDSAGNSIPPAPLSPGAVNTTGKTPYLNASLSAKTSESVPISPQKVPPTTTTTRSPPPTTTTTTAPTTTTTTTAPPTTTVPPAPHPVPPKPTPEVPTLVLTANVRAPGHHRDGNGLRILTEHGDHREMVDIGWFTVREDRRPRQPAAHPDADPRARHTRAAYGCGLKHPFDPC